MSVNPLLRTLEPKRSSPVSSEDGDEPVRKALLDIAIQLAQDEDPQEAEPAMRNSPSPALPLTKSNLQRNDHCCPAESVLAQIAMPTTEVDDRSSVSERSTGPPRRQRTHVARHAKDTSPPERCGKANGPLATTSRHCDETEASPAETMRELEHSSGNATAKLPSKFLQKMLAKTKRGNEATSASGPETPSTSDARSALETMAAGSDANKEGSITSARSSVTTEFFKTSRRTTATDDGQIVLQASATMRPTASMECTQHITVQHEQGATLPATEDEHNSSEAEKLPTLKTAPSGNILTTIFGKRRESKHTSHQKQKQTRVGQLLNATVTFLPDSRWRRYYNVLQLGVVAYFFFTTVLVIVPHGPQVLDALGLEYRFESTSRTERSRTAGIEFAVAVLSALHVAVTFNTAFLTASELVDDRKAIALNYVKSWGFYADVASSFPLDVIALLGGAPFTVFAVFRSLRLLSVLHIPRLFLLSNPNMMSVHYVQYYFTIVPLLLFSVYGLGLLHLLVCARVAFATDDEAINYYDAFKWVVNILLNSNVFSPQIDTFPQEAYALFCTFLAIIVQSAVVGKVTLVLLKADVGNQIEERMRETLEVLQHYKIPRLLQEEVLAFQFHALQNELSSNFASTLGSLPPVMQDELSVYVRIGLVEKVPMFASSSTDCKFLLARGLQREYYEPRQHIISAGEDGDCMYFLSHGFADVVVGADLVVATLKSGQFFGEIALLQDCKRTANIVSLTYCELHRLDKVDFDAIMDIHADFYDAMQQEKEKRKAPPPPPPAPPAPPAPPSGDEDAPRREERAVSFAADADMKEASASTLFERSDNGSQSVGGVGECSGQTGRPPLPKNNTSGELSIEDEEMRRASQWSGTSGPFATLDVGAGILRRGALDRAASFGTRGVLRGAGTGTTSFRQRCMLGNSGNRRPTSPKCFPQRPSRTDSPVMGPGGMPGSAYNHLLEELEQVKELQRDVLRALRGGPAGAPLARGVSMHRRPPPRLARFESGDLESLTLESADGEQAAWLLPRSAPKADNGALLATEQLTVTIVSVENYPRQDPYVRLYYPPRSEKALAQTTIKKGQPSCEFDESFAIPVTPDRNVLRLDCRDWERFGSDVHVGDLYLDLRRRGPVKMRLTDACTVTVRIDVVETKNLASPL